MFAQKSPRVGATDDMTRVNAASFGKSGDKDDFIVDTSLALDDNPRRMLVSDESLQRCVTELYICRRGSHASPASMENSDYFRHDVRSLKR